MDGTDLSDDTQDGLELGREEPAAAVAADPASDQYPALAETQRRAGRPDEARRIAEAGLALRPDHVEGRVVLGLALMDLGELEAAREVLSGVVPDAQPAPAPDAPPALESQPQSQPSDWSPDAPSFEAASPDGIDCPEDFEIDRAFASAESDPSEMMDANRVAERVLDEELRGFGFSDPTQHEALDDPIGAPLSDAVFVDASAEFEPIDDANRVRIRATLDSWLQNIRRQVV